jgi:hypothetical protein
MNYEQAVLGLQENLSRLAEVGRLQTTIIESHSQTLLLHDENQRLLQQLLREHTNLLVEHDKFLVQHEKTLVAHEAMLLELAEGARSHEKSKRDHEEFRRKIEQTLWDIGDKLNGLIGYMGGHRPPPA